MNLPLVSVPENGFTSFANAPVVTDLETLEADVAILGVPFGIPYEMGQCRSHGAPEHIRRASPRYAGTLPRAEYLDPRARPGVAPLRIVDCGNVPGDPLDLPGNSERATEAVKAILSRGAVPIVLGGDDAVPIPVVRAFREHGPLVVVQLDQHFDFADEVKGIREGYSSPIRRISEMPWVSHIVQVGLRGAIAAWAPETAGTPGQTFALVDENGLFGWWVPEALRNSGNTLISAREVHEKGIPGILEKIPANADYFITLDFDALDASVCPAVSDPDPGGLNLWQTMDLMRGLASRGRVVGMDLAEMVPEHDIHQVGARAACQIILALIGGIASKRGDGEGVIRAA